MATTLTYPLDLLRARMAVHMHAEPRYPSYYAGLVAVARAEGLTSLCEANQTKHLRFPNNSYIAM
jgi:hypothetical protein